MNNFAKNLKELRKFNQLTQKEMAQKLNITPTCYAGYEQGYREPSLDTIIKICEIFQEDANELLGIDKTKNNNINIDQRNNQGNINNNF